jgi:hypothetical protein
MLLVAIVALVVALVVERQRHAKELTAAQREVADLRAFFARSVVAPH